MAWSGASVTEVKKNKVNHIDTQEPTPEGL